MKLRELRKASYQIHAKNRLNNWILAIVFLLIACALTSIGFFVGSLIIILPLLIMPLFFSFSLFHYIQNEKSELRYSQMFKLASLYIAPTFYGVLRFLFSYFVSILIGLIVILTSGIILFYVFEHIYNPAFINSVNNLVNNISKIESTEAAQTLINGENGVLALYSFWVNVIGAFFIVFFFIYFINRHAIAIVFRSRFISGNPYIDKQAFKDFLKNNRFKYLKVRLYLNYPLFILLTAGYWLGVFIGYKSFNEIYLISSLAELLAIGFMLPFFPFMMSNNEVMGNIFLDEYSKSLALVASRSAGATVNFDIKTNEENSSGNVIEGEISEEKPHEEDKKIEDEKKPRTDPHKKDLSDYGESGIDFE